MSISENDYKPSIFLMCCSYLFFMYIFFRSMNASYSYTTFNENVVDGFSHYIHACLNKTYISRIVLFFIHYQQLLLGVIGFLLLFMIWFSIITIFTICLSRAPVVMRGSKILRFFTVDGFIMNTLLPFTFRKNNKYLMHGIVLFLLFLVINIPFLLFYINDDDVYIVDKKIPANIIFKYRYMACNYLIFMFFSYLIIALASIFTGKP